MNMANNKIGVIYCSTGPCPYFSKQASYSLYADRSAGSLKKFLSDIDITLFSDTLEHPPLKNISKIKLLPDFPKKGAFFSKIRSLQNSPYEKTLYLDSDTMILDQRVELVFDMLEKFDILGIHGPVRVSNIVHPKYSHIPLAFPEVNGGVIAFKNNERTQQVWDKWFDLYYEDMVKKEAGNDQLSLRCVLWETNLRLGILPDEYNHRAKNPVVNEKFPNKNTVIHHSRAGYPEIKA